jgi:hypothetical protein
VEPLRIEVRWESSKVQMKSMNFGYRQRQDELSTVQDKTATTGHIHIQHQLMQGRIRQRNTMRRASDIDREERSVVTFIHTGMSNYAAAVMAIPYTTHPDKSATRTIMNETFIQKF